MNFRLYNIDSYSTELISAVNTVNESCYRYNFTSEGHWVKKGYYYKLDTFKDLKDDIDFNALINGYVNPSLNYFGLLKILASKNIRITTETEKYIREYMYENSYPISVGVLVLRIDYMSSKAFVNEEVLRTIKMKNVSIVTWIPELQYEIYSYL